MSGNECTNAAKSCQEPSAPPRSTHERGSADAPKKFQERRAKQLLGFAEPIAPCPKSVFQWYIRIGLGDGATSQWMDGCMDGWMEKI